MPKAALLRENLQKQAFDLAEKCECQSRPAGSEWCPRWSLQDGEENRERRQQKGGELVCSLQCLLIYSKRCGISQLTNANVNSIDIWVCGKDENGENLVIFWGTYLWLFRSLLLCIVEVNSGWSSSHMSRSWFFSGGVLLFTGQSLSDRGQRGSKIK